MSRKCLYIKDTETSFGITLCIKATIRKGMLVFKLRGPIYDMPLRNTIRVSKHEHIKDVAGQYMNHSFYPNCKIVGKNVIATMNIKPGDELTYNYNESEINMACPFMHKGKLVVGKI